ncbi:uncharacterized protein LOC8278027 [Ricinus communis]|uniref:uncharacterized protein LOC8278027 n=1 Tax=Ricinus communis TaxID=3988 RepID=UPI00201AE65C|nr:uncharacterized protein LOC8278027 [Ricinus communis]
MGTKLDYAINLLAPSPNSTSFSVHCVDDLEDYLQTKGLSNNFQSTGRVNEHHSSMNDRMPEKNNTDFIRKTMQIHEDIFKHQVRELHRLYSVQKMLMEELKKEIKQKKRYWSPMTGSDIVSSDQLIINQQHNSTAQQTSHEYDFKIQSLRDDPSPRERSSSSCSGETMRIMARGFDLERPAEEDMSLSTAVSAIHQDLARARTSSSYIPFTGNRVSNHVCSDEESEVELTLSIGGSSKSKKATDHHQELLDSPAPSFKSERGEECSRSAPTTPMSSYSATFDQERKHPHWLFQSLSINRST